MKAELYFNRRLGLHRYGSIKHSESKCDYYYCSCRRNTNTYNMGGYTYYDVPKCASQKIRKAIGYLGAHLRFSSSMAFLNMVVASKKEYSVYGVNERFAKIFIEYSRKQFSIPNFMKGNKDNYAFAFVRDPVARVVSAFKMFKYPNSPSRVLLKYHIFGDEELAFKDFVEYIYRNPLGNCHWIEADKFIPKDRSVEVYKVESFDESWRKICKKINISYDNIKINESKQEKVDVDKGLEKLIEDIYRNDYERFGY